MRGDVVELQPQRTVSFTGKRITLAEVAEAAGVSKITVSRALRGSSLVKPVVRDRIQSTAAAFGYRMNLAARDLRLRQRLRIAVVIDMAASDERPLSDPYPLALLGGIMHECATAGFAVVLTTNDPRMRVEAQDTSGLIVLGQGAHHKAVRALTTLNLPLVVYPSLCSVALRGLPRHRHAAMMGLVVIFSALGGTIGSFLTGLLFQTVDGAVAFYATLAPVALIAMALPTIRRQQRLTQDIATA